MTPPAAPPVLRSVGRRLHGLVRVGDGRNISGDRDCGMSTLMTHTLRRDVDRVRLVFGNWYDDLGQERAGPNPIAVRAEIRLARGRHLPVTFGARPAAILAPGATVLSDPVDVALARSERFATCTAVTVGPGERYPLGSQTDPDLAEGSAPGDRTRGRAVEPRLGYGYAPWLILAEDPTPSRAEIVVVGDSNAAGFGDRRGELEHHGWVRRALDEDVDHISIAMSGATALRAASVHDMQLRLSLLRWSRPAFALTALGTNDLRGGLASAGLRAALLSHWKVLIERGMSVFACTIPPSTNSADGWRTTTGQTAGPGTAARLAVNAWLRTVPAPLSGVVDLAGAVETGALWRPGMTDDGVHLSAAGHRAVAAVVTERLAGAWRRPSATRRG
ncbi:SGNH/GDSL hydrolase family protein [Streptomyces aculeolatus]